MTLGRQWDERLKIWDAALAGEYFHPTSEITCKGSVTKDGLSLSEVKKLTFSDFPKGTKWGAKWEYGWFKSDVRITEKEAGKRVLVHLGVGPEMLVFINGKAAGSIDKKHSFVELSPCAVLGDTIKVLAECYAGHGVRREEGGIFDREAVPVPEPSDTQVTVEKSYIGVFDEEVFSAYMDFHTLYGLLQILPETSLRAAKVAEGLKKFTCTADLEAEPERRRETILEAAKGLTELLKKKNGDTVPEYTIFGQSHIDLAWLWTPNETRRKVARTFSNQLALLKRYAEQSFLVCEPILLEYLKEYYPDLYEETVQAVKDGRFFADGATYVESDTNLISGESLIRQLMWGKRWYKEELGVESRMLWLPDTFGFTGALPQIMKGCRVDYFATQKLLRCDPECDQFPYTNFWWEGIDGTRVLSHLYKKNNANLTVAALDERWKNDNRHNDTMEGMIFPYGFGDGGGGATEEMTETLKRCRDLEGLPKCKIESPEKYFKKLAKHEIDNIYYGELYLSWHRGTYTVQAALKNLNRRAEFALRNAEMLASMLMMDGLTGSAELKEVREELKALWKTVLFEQFHDVIAGSSIEQVNREAASELETVIDRAERLSKKLLEELTHSKNAAFNSLSWKRSLNGREIPSIGVLCSNSVKNAAESTEPKAKAEAPEAVKRTVSLEKPKQDNCLIIKNDFYTAKVNRLGQIVSLTGNDSGFEYVESGRALNAFRLYRDVNTCYDAWELGRMFAENEEIPPSEKAFDAECTDNAVILHTVLGNDHFTIRQEIRFMADTPRIDFVTDADWDERHKLLKTDFPTNIYTKDLYSEIQFGFIKRPTHKSRQFEKDMYEVSQHKYSFLSDGHYGLAVLNDSKYGISATDSCMSLSLLRAPVIPDMHADLGSHRFTYSVYPFTGSFADSRVLEEGYELNIAPVVIGKPEKTVKGVSRSYFEVTGGKTVIETIKPAENSDRAVVVRVYEAAGSACTSLITIPSNIKKAFECNMLEEKQQRLEIKENTVKLEFTPFKVKTLYLEF